MKIGKIVSLFLTAVLGTSMLLSGCGSKGGSDASNSEDGKATGKITIFQQKTEIYDQLKEMAAAYEEETGVEVEVWQISGDDYYQNLKTYMSSESGPTVFSLSSSTEIAEMSDYLEDIGDLGFLDKINDDLIAKSSGKTIGIPMTAEGFGLVYNKDLVSADTISSTDALVSLIQEAGTNNMTGLGLSQEAYFLIGQILNTPFALQEDPVSFCQDVYSGKVNIADVEEFKELGKVFEAIKESQKNPMEVSYDQNCGDFATGKAQMIHQGNWCYSLFSSYEVDFDMGMAPLPIAGNKSIAVGVPSVWCVNIDASDNDKQLAKDFLNWLYTSETGTDYLTNKFGFIPVVDGMVSENLDPLSSAVSDAIAEGDIIPWTFNEEWPAGIITTYLVQNAQEYFSSDMTTDAFLRALNDSFVTAANE
ncbi:MAG: extracellular solute-binding protein [Lachnospiraceae bacterium]|nr:extracellular solute-binding protein [Lachnospiraceae bacterium]MDE6185505.1 extracellular solute-binding protein [Lachnospiraceae bacterium]